MSLVPYKFTDMQITEDQKRFFERNLPLVTFFLNRHFQKYLQYGDRKFEYADLYQIACFGLLRAVKKYDPKKGKFSTYAGECIKGTVMHYLRKFIPFGKRKPSDAIHYSYSYDAFTRNGVEVEDDVLRCLVSPYGNTDVTTLDSDENILKILNPVNLTESEREVLLHYLYSQKSTYQDRGLEIGRTKNNYAYLYKKALRKVRNYYSNNPLPIGV